jgi:hypothetical protein
MFYQSTKLRPLEEGSGLREQNDGSQPELGLYRSQKIISPAETSLGPPLLKSKAWVFTL